ncbi:glycosyltransferase family 2 protein [Saccharopolyspora mangrovi]|uniref:Glycosyltransferase family 2 protein n=1 Tax=Saccharopolyspora mangrovi TaxID=3082379 RepID=A0ABU6A9J0_9PSEU|nr:glycosyltransferase family 2 protein [Saccharopolyspora sp. S2-29]MEB3368156.1 glycosyltransferase family 2 protein [Saccharopolyspora sp. S2-29]
MASDEVRTTVIVITWRGRAHIDACLAALSAQSRPHRTLVVDNASDDGTAPLLAAHPDVEVLRLPRNVGYAGGLAAALPEVATPFVAWLNDDAAPAPDWLEVVEGNLSRTPTAAAATSVLLTPDGEVQSTGVRLTADGHGADATGTGAVFGFCGGAALLRTEVLREVGGVPAEFFCYYEDTDTAWRLRLAGFDVVRTEATSTHLHGASTRPGSALFHRWNEGNRLLTLLRCAPAGVAVRELARFAAITVLLPWRKLPHPPPNLRAALRLRVLVKVALLLPAALRARWRIGRAARVSRREVWAAWAGR